MISTPCENASRYVLPALRANVARLLAKNNYTQKSIAKILGITQPAVSKYLSGNFDGKLKFIVNNEVLKEYANEIYKMIIQGEPEEDVRFALLSKASKLIKENPNMFD
jgi:predicted transcriptional regulator